jgi:hypothetical protein
MLFASSSHSGELVADARSTAISEISSSRTVTVRLSPGSSTYVRSHCEKSGITSSSSTVKPGRYSYSVLTPLSVTPTKRAFSVSRLRTVKVSSTS